MMRVLVADGHAAARQGLRQLLFSVSGIEVVAEAEDAAQTMGRVRNGGLDIVLLDMNTPGCSGIDLIQRIKTEAPAMPVLALATHSDWQIASRAIKAGAGGYLAKDCPAEVLVHAIRRVGGGENVIDPALATRIAFRGGNAGGSGINPEMSNREYQVFVALAHGKSLTAIAEELHLSAKTVSTHKARLMNKLGIVSLSQLVRYAIRHGVID